MTLVVDAAFVVAWLVDDGPCGRWADEALAGVDVAAPHLMPAEVTNVLRRAVHGGDISADAAAMARADLEDLRVELYPFEPFATRVWDLRENLTAYDAWYVAVAETLEAELVTLDVRLSRAPGLRCPVSTPPPLA